MRVVCCGTGRFGLATLRTLINGPHDIVSVVTQPDRRTGRARRRSRPIADAASEAGVPLLEPACCNDGALAVELDRLGCDVAVLVAYGQKIGAKLLSVPRLGWINLHASLLPAYRGAAPIAWALVDGAAKTGVTVIQVAERIDTGDILAQEEVAIREEENADELELRLADVGAELVMKVLEDLDAGHASPVPQDGRRASRAPRIHKDQGRIDWSVPARRVSSLVSALTPWPGAQAALTSTQGTFLPILIRRAVAVGGDGAPGDVLAAGPEGITVACGQGALRVMELQAAGGKRLSARDFLNGHPIKAGDSFVTLL